MGLLQLDLEDIDCSHHLKEELALLSAAYHRCIDTGEPHTFVTIVYPSHTEGCTHYVVQAHLVCRGRDVFAARGESWDVEEAITEALLGLTEQLRYRLHHLHREDHADRVYAG